MIRKEEFKELKEVKRNTFKLLMEGFKEIENNCNDCLNLRKYDKG